MLGNIDCTTDSLR